MADLTSHFVCSNIGSGYEYTWESGEGMYGKYIVEWAFDVYITIYENRRENVIGHLKCAFPSGSSAAGSFSSGSAVGGGFCDAAGLMWGDASYTEQSASLPDDTYDSQATAESQLRAFCPNYICYFGYKNSSKQPFFAAQAGSYFERDITVDDLDSNGNLKQLKLLQLFKRWYDWSDDGTTPREPASARLAKVTFEADITSGLNIDWKFYPWAVKKSGEWKSLNRDYPTTPSPSRTAYHRRKEGGQWQDVLNTLQPNNPNDQMSWRKQSNNWLFGKQFGNN